MLRVRTDIAGMVTGPAVNTLYFSGSGATDAAAANTAAGNFWTAVLNQFPNYGTVTTQNIVEELTVGGTLTALWPVVPRTGTGTNVTDQLPEQIQGLMRLNTGVIINGRQSVGHIFIPGPCENANTVGGYPASTYISDWGTAGAALIAAAPGLVVWSRAHTSINPVTSALVWHKWATLKSRRD